MSKRLRGLRHSEGILSNCVAIRTTAVAAISAAMIAALVIPLASCGKKEVVSKADESSVDVKEQSATEAADTDLDISKEWKKALDKEQQAALDLSYETSVADGYEGTREEWENEEVKVSYDHNGDLVISTPDGAEFTVYVDDVIAASAESDVVLDKPVADEGESDDESDDNADESQASDPDTEDDAGQTPKPGDPSPAEEWENVITPEQQEAIDEAYEADVEQGYEGTEDEWIEENVDARYDEDGDVVITMPDGSEVEIPADEVQTSNPQVSFRPVLTSPPAPTGRPR